MLYSTLKAEQKQLDAGKDPYAPKKGDSVAMAAFRGPDGGVGFEGVVPATRGGGGVGQRARRHGLYMLRVRGTRKVQAVLVLFALAHNLQRAAKLRGEREANERGR